jgi:hypothetical protein
MPPPPTPQKKAHNSIFKKKKAHRSSSSSPHLILPNLLHTDGPLPSLATRSWEPLCLSCNVKFFLMVNIYYYYE